MKVTNYRTGGLPLVLAGWSSGFTSVNSNFNTIDGGFSATNFVQGITANGSNMLLRPIANFAAGSNILLSLDSGPGGSIPSNTIRIHSTGGSAGTLVTSNGSNGLGAIINLQAGVGIALGVSGQTITIMNAGAGAGGGAAEYDYIEFTAPVAISATTEATANTVVTGSAVAYDGATAIVIEFFAPYYNQGTATNAIDLVLYDGSSSIGILSSSGADTTTAHRHGPVYASRRLTPSAASHTYSIRAFITGGANGNVQAGAGGNGNWMPGFIRITRA